MTVIEWACILFTAPYLWTVECDKAPKLFLIPMVINFPRSQEFMISSAVHFLYIIISFVILYLRTCDSTQECWPGDASPGRGRQPRTLRIWWAGYWPRLAGLSRRTGGGGDQHCYKYHQDLHCFILDAPLGVTGAPILSVSLRLCIHELCINCTVSIKAFSYFNPVSSSYAYQFSCWNPDETDIIL